MKYDLRASVKQVLDGSSLNSPAEIAAKVAEDVPSHALRACLRLTLAAYAAQIIREDRNYASPNFQTPASQTALGSQNDVAGGAPSAARRSWGARYRDAWQRSLTSRVHVGDSQWKQLGDCTYADLEAIAAERNRNAEKNAAAARYYNGLRALLTEHAVDTVRDLPTEVLMDALGRAA